MIASTVNTKFRNFNFYRSYFSDLSKNYFRSFDVDISLDQKKVIDIAIRNTESELLKADFVNLSLNTENNSLVNLIDPSKKAVKVGSPTFTQYKGWIGTGTDYINMNYNPGDGNVYKLKKDLGTVLVYLNNYNRQKNSYILGHSSGLGHNAICIMIENNDLLRMSCNYTRNVSNIPQISVNYYGFVHMRRISTFSMNIGTDKTYNDIDNGGGASLVSGNILYARNLSRICFVFMGGYLTNAEMSKFQDAWLPVFQYLGSNYSV